eukprot:15078683-Heterocapsa_arctica.AAC.1
MAIARMPEDLSTTVKNLQTITFENLQSHIHLGRAKLAASPREMATGQVASSRNDIDIDK